MSILVARRRTAREVEGSRLSLIELVKPYQRADGRMRPPEPAPLPVGTGPASARIESLRVTDRDRNAVLHGCEIAILRVKTRRQRHAEHQESDRAPHLRSRYGDCVNA